MRVYLDNCCFNRPYDDQTLLMIRLETEAKLAIQEKIKSGNISLVWSYILDLENNANPFIERRIEIQRWKNIAEEFVNETEEILLAMDNLVLNGLKSLDALHIACAISLNCDFFLTVDKGILKKSTQIREIEVINPISLISQWES